MSKGKKILLGVTGSVGAYKSADLLRRLQADGHEVTVVMSKEAEKFISALTLASLSGQKVHQDLFDPGDAWKMPHISLGRATNLFLIVPATAHMIGKLANGLADDLITCTALATSAPILIVPAMNDLMYQNKFVQSNIKKLQDNGIRFVSPIQGKLACGITGEGHIADDEEILAAVKACLKEKK